MLGYAEHCKEHTGTQWCYWLFAVALPHIPNMWDDYMNGDEGTRNTYIIGVILMSMIPMALALLE